MTPIDEAALEVAFDLRATAYHEAAHAVVALACDMRVHKLSLNLDGSRPDSAGYVLIRIWDLSRPGEQGRRDNDTVAAAGYLPRDAQRVHEEEGRRSSR
jgi:hypothetical protein